MNDPSAAAPMTTSRSCWPAVRGDTGADDQRLAGDHRDQRVDHGHRDDDREQPRRAECELGDVLQVVLHPSKVPRPGRSAHR
jgi:hypothetical protein